MPLKLTTTSLALLLLTSVPGAAQDAGDDVEASEAASTEAAEASGVDASDDESADAPSEAGDTDEESNEQSTEESTDAPSEPGDTGDTDGESTDAPSEDDADTGWDEPTEALLPPARLDETPFIPELDELPPDLGADNTASWQPEAAVSVGVYASEAVAPGVSFGAGFQLVEHGPDTIPPHMTGGTFHERRLWGIVDAEFGFDPGGAGLSEIDVMLSVFGHRQDGVSSDGSERGVSDIVYGPVTIERSFEMDRELALTVAIVEGNAARVFRVRDHVELGVDLRVGTTGYKHLDYALAPDQYFNGVRLIALGVDAVPTFTIGDGTVRARYILGGDADLSLGSRNGSRVSGRFTSVSDLRVHSGFGFDFGRFVSWDNLVAYRASVDAVRTNVANWIMSTTLTGRY